MQLVGCLHAYPYPRPDSRPEPDQPGRVLPVTANHLGELPHDPHPLLLVYELKEIAFDPLARVIPEQLASPFRKVLDLPVRAYDDLCVVRDSAPLDRMAIGWRAVYKIMTNGLIHKGTVRLIRERSVSRWRAGGR